MIVATAGHVDHGKTSLVRNLTGIETDRLEEEQRRGLSINLGYAYKQLDAGCALGFIDVPGHRRFINTMISGVSGIDLGLLVVAADDGPMPQTHEHLAVMDLLGVKRYLVTVTKCDRVSEERIREVSDEITVLLPDDTAVYHVSNTTGSGITELKSELERRARLWTDRVATGHFRMSIDRSFHLQGRGLILTGTIASGSVAIGDTLAIQPQGQALRVRGMHTQDKPAAAGKAGERCALDITGDVHKDEIERGDWVAAESCIETTSRFDTRIRLLPEAAFALKHLSYVKLHIGAKHLQARLMLLRTDSARAGRIQPGESALAQLVTERPILCCRGDRFLLRDHGETATLGGGIVLDPHGLKYRKSSATRLDFLRALEKDDIEDAIRSALNDEACILDYDGLLKSWNIDSEERPGMTLADVSRIVSDKGNFWLTKNHWAKLKQRILDALLAFHEAKPGEQGIRVTELMRASFPTDRQHFFKPGIAELIRSGLAVFKDGILSAREHKAAPSSEEHKDWIAISACLRKHGKLIPNVSQLEQECGIERRKLKEALSRAQRERKVLKISSKRYAELSLLDEYAQAALDLTQENPTFTLVEYRNKMGCGRNLGLEVLEYFDAVRFTRRDGNGRTILNRALPEKLFRL